MAHFFLFCLKYRNFIYASHLQNYRLMKTKNQLSFIFITVISMLSGFTFSVKANDFTNSTLTIDEDFASGTLEIVIGTVNSDFSDIKALCIQKGTLDTADIFWVRDSLPNLANLLVIYDASFANNSLPENSMSNHQKIKTCTLPKTTTIGKNAFRGCKNLSEVDIYSVESIGDSAFAGCPVLWKLEPGATNPPSVGRGAFEGCHYYRQIRLPYEGKQNYMAVDDGNKNDMYWYGFELLVPHENKVEISGFETGFLSATIRSHQSNLNNITSLFISGGQLNSADIFWIRDSLVHLGYLTINEDATFTNNLVPANALKNCTNLFLIIVSTATKIGEHAFDGCTNLISADVSAASEIGDFAFKNCHHCVQLLLTDNPPDIGTNTFTGCTAANKYIDLSSTSNSSAFKAVNDGNTNDSYWHGWELQWGGSTVIQVNTDEGGNIDLGMPNAWDSVYENVNGAFFWNGEDWNVNDTYGHMFFQDLRENGIIINGNRSDYNYSTRTGNYSGINTVIPSETTVGIGRIIYGYIISAENYSYTVNAQNGGVYFYNGIKYTISQPDGTKIGAYSRGNGNGAGNAYFEIVFEDTSPGPGITTFREGGVVSDATGFSPGEAIENPMNDSLVTGRLVTTDTTNHKNRYFLDINGGHEMGGMSYIIETTYLPQPKTDEAYKMAATYINRFSVHFKNGEGRLESFKVSPLLISESYSPPTAISNKAIRENDRIELIIFPNPAKSQFRVQGLKLKVENTTIEIYGLAGKKLLEKPFPAGSENIEVDVSHLENGVYLCRMIMNKKSMTKKLIIQK